MTTSKFGNSATFILKSKPVLLMQAALTMITGGLVLGDPPLGMVEQERRRTCMGRYILLL
jgi:hypothetical protein